MSALPEFSCPHIFKDKMLDLLRDVDIKVMIIPSFLTSDGTSFTVFCEKSGGTVNIAVDTTADGAMIAALFTDYSDPRNRELISKIAELLHVHGAVRLSGNGEQATV